MKVLNALVLSLVLSTAVVDASERESGGRVATKSIHVEFGSIGSGIDSAALDKLKALVVASILEGEVEIYTEKNWAREGEVTLCIEFKEFSVAHSHYPEINAILENAKYVNKTYPRTCRQ